MSLNEDLERHHEDAWGWALRCADGVRDHAEDVLHDAYVRVLGGGARFDGRSSFRTWLFGVIRLVAMEHRRRRARDPGDGPAPSDGPSRDPDPLEHAERSDEADRLREALAELSEGQRDVLHLVFYQGCTLAEAAEVLGLALGTVRTHYARGKAHLRERLAPLGIP